MPAKASRKRRELFISHPRSNWAQPPVQPTIKVTGHRRRGKLDSPGNMTPSIRLGRLFGIEIGFNWSLIFIAALIAWTLAVDFLPGTAPGYEALTYWLAASFGAVLFYASLLAHELSHAVVARRNGVKVAGITLWLFGGVSQLEGEPASARAEALIAGVGPLTSFVIAAIAFAVAAVTSSNALRSGLVGWLTCGKLVLGL